LGGLSSCVQENHDFQIFKVKSASDGSTENVIYDDLSPEVFNTPDLQMFVVNGSMLVSFIGLNSKPPKPINQSAPGGPPIVKQMMDNYMHGMTRSILFLFANAIANISSELFKVLILHLSNVC